MVERAKVGWERRRRWRGAASLLIAALMLPIWGGAAAVAAQGGCQTPFQVYTDPDNPGSITQNGVFRMIGDSGLLGEFRGDGRFAGYTIDGWQDATVNDAAGMANVRGAFIATSPDGRYGA